MFYGIFMALYYVFTSMLIFIFKVCWETPCGEIFYFVEIIQLIRGVNQVNGFCIVWVSTVMNIRADYRFCCFNINKLSCYVIFRKGSCTTDLLVLYLDAGQYRSVEGEIGCFINRIAPDFFFCLCDARISLNNLLPVLSFLLIVIFCVLLGKCSFIRITVCANSSREISWCNIITFLRVYFNKLSSMVQFFNFAKSRH